MRLSCARYALLLLLMCVACTRDVAVPELAGSVPPMSQLRDVTLGMRASTLVSRRPRAIAAPYAGFVETVGPYRVLYEVPGSVQDGRAPSGWERLASVTASERLPSADSALHRWRAEVEGMQVALHAAPQCYSEAGTSRSRWIAVWPRAGAEVFVLERPPVSSPNGRLDPALIEFGVAPTADHIRAIFGLTVRQSCGASSGPPAG